MLVREEEASDAEAISRVHRAAFPSDAESRLVEGLRRSGNLVVSLVAEHGGSVVAHVAFSPVQINGPAGTSHGLGLAPVAVLPECQRGGFGSALIRQGLERCKGRAAPFVVVLGEPAYYQRFGFMPAHTRGIGNEYRAHDEFMVIEFAEGALPRSGGVARYAPEFALV